MKKAVHYDADDIKKVLADRHNVETLSRRQVHLPVVMWHASDDIVMGECPAATYMAVLHPDIFVLRRKADLRHGILHEDGRMRFAVVVHDVPLVTDNVLQGQCRGEHLTRCAEMIELTVVQRYDGHRQPVQVAVSY